MKTIGFAIILGVALAASSTVAAPVQTDGNECRALIEARSHPPTEAEQAAIKECRMDRHDND